MKADNDRLLSDKINYLKRIIQAKNRRKLTKAIMNRFRYLSYEETEKIINCVNDICIKNNCYNFKIASKREGSVVLSLNNKVIKITNRQYDYYKYLTEYVSNSRSILQPDSEAIVELVDLPYNMKILELEKLNTKGITYNDVMEIYFKLREDGYLWYDTRKENLGKDKNGNILLFNYGELININDLNYYDKKKKLNAHIRRKPELSLAYIRYQERYQELKIKTRKKILRK